MKFILKAIVVVLFFITGFLIHLNNPDVVAFSFPFINLQWPLGLLVLVSLLLGVLIGGLLMSFSLLKSKIGHRQTNKKLNKVEKEVENLRTMPIKNEV